MSTTEAQKSSPRTDHSKVLLNAVRGTIEPVDKTPFYTLGVILVTGMLVLLVAVYLGMIVISCGAFVAALVGGIGGIFRLVVLFLAPIFVLFLIKPIFVPRPSDPTPKRIKREAEPVLFAYVEQLCQAIGAPVPDSIRVNCEVNAAAQKSGGEFILHIGLPLVAGMNVRAFTEVLSHEFGHFTQGALYKANMPVRLLNYWFYRVVMERDVIDVWLEEASKTDGLAWFAWPIAKMVLCTRYLLYCLMVMSNAVSCFMLREAEYDADRYAARVVGSTVIVRSNRRMRELGVAYQFAIGNLRRFWNEGRLADNFPKLMVANFKHIDDKIRRELRKMQQAEQNAWFLTHPRDLDREESAAEENTPGILHLPPEYEKVSASVLFANFDRLCKFATLEMYREMVDPELDPDVLHSVEELLQRQQEEEDAYKHLFRYFQGKISPIRPLPLPKLDYAAPKQPQRNVELIKFARDRLMNSLQAYQKCNEKYRKADASLLDATRAIAVIQAGFRVDPVSFGMVYGSTEEADKKSRDAKYELGELAGQLAPFEDANAKRMYAALQLLWVPKVAERVPDAEKLRKNVEKALPVAQFTNSMLKDLVDFRTLYSGLLTLVRNWNEQTSQHVSMLRACHNRIEAINTRLRVYYKEIGDDMKYPFDHKKKNLLLREYVLPVVPDEDDWQGTLVVADDLMDRFIDVHVRALAKLATAAEQVEIAVGFPQLPEIEVDDEDEEKAADADEGEGLVESEWNQKKGQTAVIAGLAFGLVLIGAVIFGGVWMGLRMVTGKSRTVATTSTGTSRPNAPLATGGNGTLGQLPVIQTNTLATSSTNSGTFTPPNRFGSSNSSSTSGTSRSTNTTSQTSSSLEYFNWARLPFSEARQKHPTRLLGHVKLETSNPPVPPAGVEVVRGAAASFFLAKPPGDGPFPAVLVAHDGHSLDQSAYDAVAQRMVEQGYLVMMPNWRGENGNPGRVEWCCGEVDDAALALQYLLSRPDVDQDSVVAYGKGTGGTLVLLLAAMTDSLKGVVACEMNAKLVNQVTSAGSLPFTVPYDRNDRYEQTLRSPQLWRNSMKCPTIVQYEPGESPYSVSPVSGSRTYSSRLDTDTMTKHLMALATGTHAVGVASSGTNTPSSSRPAEPWKLTVDPPQDVPKFRRLADLNILVPKLSYSSGEVDFAPFPSACAALGKVSYNQARIEVWDLAEQKHLGVVATSGSSYREFTVSTDGQLVAIRNRESLEVYKTGQPGAATRCAYPKQFFNVDSMRFVDDKHVVLQSYDTLVLVDADRGTTVKTFDFKASKRGFCSSPGGKYVAAISTSGQVIFFDTDSGSILQRAQFPGVNLSGSDLIGLDISCDGKQLAFGTEDRLILVDVATGDIVRDISISTLRGTEFRYGYDGPYLQWFPNGKWLLRHGYQVIDTNGRVQWTGPYNSSNSSKNHRVLDEEHVAVTLMVKSGDRFLKAAELPVKDFD